MKRLLAFTLVAIVVFIAGAVSAQELGNPAKLIKKGQIDVGLQGTLIIKQSFADYELKRTYSNGTHNSSQKGADFEDDGFYMATITYGIIDQINIFARLGLADGGKWIDKQPGNAWKGNLESQFVWAVGAKGKAFELDNGFGMEIGAQYLRYDKREVKDWRNQETGETAGQLGWNTNDTFDYWQVDGVVNAYWTIGAFTPYVGAGYSYSHVNFSGRWTNQNPDYGWVGYDSSSHNEDRFSALIGLDLDLGDHFKVNLQGTFVSRTAVTLGISYCF
ncbi:MAG: hypothetical protein ISR62_07845 [Desulfobacteraceae bacterium]|jgi:outer membrane protein W|nr:hypothetical protein [Desulfobacterales bacterium]MBL6968316.1 hypothetical protein [Desulfobacteraceae bacterium]MBL7101191.1 hypothetical protein [Desulfobacteraceae bacterium]MBL7171920.1 hypothetical protein [Desulfobacteraceae bacterium]